MSKPQPTTVSHRATGPRATGAGPRGRGHGGGATGRGHGAGPRGGATGHGGGATGAGAKLQPDLGSAPTRRVCCTATRSPAVKTPVRGNVPGHFGQGPGRSPVFVTRLGSCDQAPIGP